MASRPHRGWAPSSPRRRSASLCGAFGLFLLGLAIYAGFEGTSAPDRNIALTLLFVTAWLGFPLLGVLFGNVFPAFNPWNAIAAPVGLAWRRVAGSRSRTPQLPGEARPLAGRGRPVRLRLARADLRDRGRGVGRGGARVGRPGCQLLHRLHADHGRGLRPREVVRQRRGLLGLLRHVRLARQARVPRRRARHPALPRRLDPLGHRRRARSRS